MKKTSNLETILQISSVGRPINPNLKYGGTARVIMYLDEEFTKLGYNSLVAATGDSKIFGNLIRTVPESLSLFTMNGEKNGLIRPRREYDSLSEKHYSIILNYIIKNNPIDVIHDHPGSGILLSKKFKKVGSQILNPILITLHGAFSEKYSKRYGQWNKIALEHKNIYFNALSENQRKTFENNGFKISAVIPHGIPLEKFSFHNNKMDYLFSIGRICPKKGQHIAIKVSKQTKRPLIIAGEVNSAHHSYWKELIEPYLTFSISKIPLEKQEEYKNSLIEDLKLGKNIIDEGEIIYLGSLTDKQKIPLYSLSKAFLMPIQWQEPFGLTMIESMACGTPVVATPFGSVFEIVKDNETGIIIKESKEGNQMLEQIIEAIENINLIQPKRCREHIEKNFSIKREANNYLKLYDAILKEK